MILSKKDSNENVDMEKIKLKITNEYLKICENKNRN